MLPLEMGYDEVWWHRDVGEGTATLGHDGMCELQLQCVKYVFSWVVCILKDIEGMSFHSMISSPRA